MNLNTDKTSRKTVNRDIFATGQYLLKVAFRNVSLLK